MAEYIFFIGVYIGVVCDLRIGWIGWSGSASSCTS